MHQIYPSKTPAILDKVASLTTIRDIDIFEFSFLKTLAGMLNVNIVSLYKYQNFNESCRLIQYNVNIAPSEDGYNESRGVRVETIKVPEEIKKAQSWIDSTGEVYSIKQEDKFNIVYPVTGTQGNVGYLSIIINHQLSNADNLVISSLLSISQIFHALLEENQKDKLTGLLNRKTFDDNIAKIQNILNSSSVDVDAPYRGEEKRQNHLNEEFWLCIIDIDFFKNINDSFGHVYGDEVLLMLSQQMRKTFRPTDLLFRFGGEEFVVIVKVQNKQEAEHAFERFRVAIEDFRFPQVGQVTISLGATQIMQEHAIGSDIVGRADDALYYAKENGRNKLFFYEDLLADGTFSETVEDGDVELF